MSSSSSNGAMEFFKKTLNDIQEMPQTNQIVIGGVSGLATGYVIAKIGKIAAFTLGSSVLMLQVAQHFGYIEIKFTKKSKLDELKKKALKAAEDSGLVEQKSERAVKEVKKFLSNNLSFGLAFGGGLLIGFSF